jgi:hypothetical protein
METNYLCPKCKSLLNIGEKIVLSVRLENKKNGLLLLEKNLGDYNVKKQNNLHLREGEMVEFFCPICHENLQSSIHTNLAGLIMTDETESEYNIYFSRISGEQATFKVKNEQKEAFGRDQNNYSDLFK